MPNNIPVTNPPLSLSFTLSRLYQMVSVMFKTVYLFFALFALPHVLAAPGPAALGVRSLTLQDEAIEAHNAARQRNGTPPLTWTEELAVLAGPHAHACEKQRTAPLGTPSRGLSLSAEKTHI